MAVTPGADVTVVPTCGTTATDGGTSGPDAGTADGTTHVTSGDGGQPLTSVSVVPHMPASGGCSCADAPVEPEPGWPIAAALLAALLMVRGRSDPH